MFIHIYIHMYTKLYIYIYIVVVVVVVVVVEVVVVVVVNFSFARSQCNNKFVISRSLASLTRTNSSRPYSASKLKIPTTHKLIHENLIC